MVKVVLFGNKNNFKTVLYFVLLSFVFWFCLVFFLLFFECFCFFVLF